MYSSVGEDVQSYSSHVTGKSANDHSIVPPCQAACPLHMDIRGYVDLVAQGKIMEALKVIRDGNPFPSICAHVCTHPCEEHCRRSQVDSSIAIRSLKRFAVEFGGDSMIQAEAKTTHQERIAIVGSGPAGLSCAYYLRKLGYQVTVFEAHAELGGMLRVGIPQYRLPREVLNIEVKRLSRMGIEIRTGTQVVSIDLLFDMGYKAVFITVGAHKSLKMGVEGEDLSGVIDGVTFLREVNLGLRPFLGEKVAVVGGGNVSIDAARTALRLGSQQVTVLYRRGKQEMPADRVEVAQALEEGVSISFLVAPIRIKREKTRLLVTCTRMELGERDASGRCRPVPVENSEFEETYDTLISAIGQVPQTPGDFHVRIGRGSTIQVDQVTLTTNRSGVFAGGDVVTGPATVTEALAAGRLAAYRIDEYLQHNYPKVGRATIKSLDGMLSPETIEAIKKIGRFDPPVLAPEARSKDFKPIEQVYDWATATSEARRCLRCGMGAEILFQDKCASCLTCLRVCPYHVPRLDSSGTVQIPPDQCLACGVCVAECPARAIVLRKPCDRRQVHEELQHVIDSTMQLKNKPLIVGFCCQYGLFGAGTLANLWRSARAGVAIVPVPCAAKVETTHLLHAFECGAEGVFVASCGEYCARENTAFWVLQHIEKVRQTLASIGLEPGRLQAFISTAKIQNPAAELDKFTELVSNLCLNRILVQEVKS
jgi:NADPH-dependent glutamate synthase beta subunit-like oxidoreductase/coenzyme F420-reducing hydrogenase delta subunit